MTSKRERERRHHREEEKGKLAPVDSLGPREGDGDRMFKKIRRKGKNKKVVKMFWVKHSACGREVIFMREVSQKTTDQEKKQVLKIAAIKHREKNPDKRQIGWCEAPGEEYRIVNEERRFNIQSE